MTSKATIDEHDETRWHLDKRVPIVLIFTMMVQLSLAIWALSAAFKDIEANRAGVKALADQIEAITKDANVQAVQLGRIEENTRGLRNDMNRLLRILERGVNSDPFRFNEN